MVNILNSLQIIFSSFTLIMFLIVRAPVQYISSYQQGKGVFRSILATALDPLTMYYFIYVILAIGAINSDYILTFFLLDIVVKNSYAMDVMIAVFTPIKQLTVAICLSLIVMYIFAMFVVSYPPSLPPFSHSPHTHHPSVPLDEQWKYSRDSSRLPIFIFLLEIYSSLWMEW